MEIKVNQPMSPNPTTINHNDELSSAFIRMRRQGLRHLPVIDDLGNVIGIISDRDFQRAMWPINTPDAHGLPDSPHFRKDARVSDYMTWPVKTLSEDTDLITAIEMMITTKISSVVITRDDQMTGIITHEDLLRVLASLLREPKSIKERALNLAYSTPLGKVADMFSTAGI